MSAVDWAAYRKCPICGAPTGSPCASMTIGFITEAVRITPRDLPHSRRELHTGITEEAEH